jgi:hypothetical protein
VTIEILNDTPNVAVKIIAAVFGEASFAVLGGEHDVIQNLSVGIRHPGFNSVQLVSPLTRLTRADRFRGLAALDHGYSC